MLISMKGKKTDNIEELSHLPNTNYLLSNEFWERFTLSTVAVTDWQHNTFPFVAPFLFL